MPRPPRIHAPGLLYHIICRGNHKRLVFLDDQDFRAYLHRVSEVHQALPFRLFAYALMKNHVHLLVEAGKVPISKVMQSLQQRYTQYFNLKYKKIGHVFHGRFKSIVCQKDAYLLELVRYIHLNPVRAGIVKDPEAYPWTSHNSYLSKKPDDWLDAAAILAQFGKGRQDALANYKTFVMAGVKDGHRENFYDLKKRRALGDDQFIEALPLGASADKDTGHKKPLEEIAGETCKQSGCKKEGLLEKGARNSTRIKALFCLNALKEGYSKRTIASYLGYCPSAFNYLMKKIGARP